MGSVSRKWMMKCCAKKIQINSKTHIFSGALTKDFEDPDTCFRKAMTNVKNKLTKPKIRNT